MPVTAKIICKGTNSFISFLTPESDVKVEDPVKFIATKEEIAPMIKNHDIVIRRFWPVDSCRYIMNTSKPEKNPFTEKYRPGI